MSQKLQTTSTSASCKSGDTRKRTVMQATFFCNLSPKRWCVASCNCLLCISNHPRANLRTTNFHVAESIRENIKKKKHQNRTISCIILPTNNHLSELKYNFAKFANLNLPCDDTFSVDADHFVSARWVCFQPIPHCLLPLFYFSVPSMVSGHPLLCQPTAGDPLVIR